RSAMASSLAGVSWSEPVKEPPIREAIAQGAASLGEPGRVRRGFRTPSGREYCHPHPPTRGEPMTARPLLPLLLFALLATPAWASSAGRPEPPPPSPANPAPEASEDKKSPRQEAEAWYNDAYDAVTKAKEALAAEKPDAKKAQKLFKKAIDRASEALQVD